MFKKLFCATLIATLLLLMLPQNAHASECEHDYTVINQNGCVTQYTCINCNKMRVDYAHNEKVFKTSCITTYKCTRCNSYTRSSEIHHTYPENVPCEIDYTCIHCGAVRENKKKHNYEFSFFGGFTYCRDCHEYSFSFWDVDWLMLTCFVGGAMFLIFVFILIPKSRRND